MTTDALGKKPTFFSGPVNDPKDPIFRGRCDFNTRCGPLLDFIDVEISPDGTPYAASVDACVTACIQNGPIDGSDAIVGRMVGGPKLR